MPLARRSAHALVSLLCTLLILLASSGCESDSDTFAATSPTDSTGTNGYFLGRVLIDDTVAASQVIITALDGAELYRLVPDESGYFSATGPLPADFQILARIDGESQPQIREVRGGYDGKTMLVSPLSTLTSLYMKAEGASLGQARQKLRRAFEMPRHFNFDFVTNRSYSPFHPRLFHALARRSGDVEGYYQMALELLLTGTAPTQSVLGQFDDDDDGIHEASSSSSSDDEWSDSGDDEGYNGDDDGFDSGDDDGFDDDDFGDNGVLNALDDDPLDPIAAREVLEGDLDPLLVKAAADSLASTIGKDILADGISLIDAGLFGAVTQAFGLNLGTTGALHAIAQQIDEVLGDLGAISNLIVAGGATTDYEITRTALADDLEAVEVGAQRVVNLALKDSSSQALSSLVAFIQASKTDANVAAITNALLGNNDQTNILYAYGQLLAINILGLSQQESVTYLSSPIRFNSLLQKLKYQETFIANHLVLAALVYGENAHLAYPRADALATASEKIEKLRRTAQNALAAVPDLLPDDHLMIDCSRGLMWYTRFQPETDIDAATSHVQAFQTGGVSGFRLATRDELEDLIQNRIGSKVSDKNNDADWRAAFTAFGFDLQHYGENKDYPAPEKYQGQSFFAEASGGGQNVYQWYGVYSAPATADYSSPYRGTPGATSSYIFVRDFPGTSERKGYGVPFAYGQLSASGAGGSIVAIETVSSTQLKATADGFCVDPTVGISFGDVTTRCYWESNTRSMATISSSIDRYLDSGIVAGIPATPAKVYAGAGPAGHITWHPPIDGSPLKPVEFKATLWAANAAGDLSKDQNGDSGTSRQTRIVTVNPPAGLSAEFSSMQIAATNYRVDTAKLSGDQNAVINFYPTIFYKDGQLYEPYVPGQSSRSPSSFDSSWALDFDFYPVGGSVVVESTAAGGGFISTQKGELLINKSLPPGQYTARLIAYPPSGGFYEATATITVDGIKGS